MKYGRRASDKTIAGRNKAATLLLSLPPEHVEKVFKLLADVEIKEITQAMANLGQIESAYVEQIHTEFTSHIASTSTLNGTVESTERLLKQVLDEKKVKGLMDDIKGPEGRTIWDKLSNIKDEILANYLQKEYPQTIAVILSNISSERAAKILVQFPSDLAIEVMERMLRVDSIKEEVLNDIEETLRTDFMGSAVKGDAKNPIVVVAEIFNSFDRATETRFLEAIESNNTETADQIRSLMFTFDDLIKLDDASIQMLISKIDKDKFSMALKGASESIKELFFKNMSERAGKLMKEEMEEMGMVRLRDVEEAQVAIVKVAKELSMEGLIVIQQDDEDEKFIS